MGSRCGSVFAQYAEAQDSTLSSAEKRKEMDVTSKEQT